MSDKPTRINLSIRPRVLRMADVRAEETGETRSGYIARLIREDWTRQKRREDDERLGPHYPEREALYQKKIRAEDGTCMFSVNVYALRWPDRMPEVARDRHRWSIGAQFYRDGVTMDLTLHHEPGMTPADVEQFYRTAHAALGCTRDPHND